MPASVRSTRQCPNVRSESWTPTRRRPKDDRGRNAIRLLRPGLHRGSAGPRSSRAWQLQRSRELVEPQGGGIVTEFFDVGQSRALPWKRRPEASRLLELFPDPDRGFEAVVIGEPQRAFYGAQFALTFPLFEHYGVDLWVPEVGGRIDPGSEAHDLVMTLFGGMSKGERSRIRTRVRNAMAAQAATEGRFLGGRPPYGYRLADAGPHPHPGKAAAGMRAHRLEPDPDTAPIVVRIYEDYVDGKGLYAIAEELTRKGIPYPSANDPERNPHRSGAAWSKSAVRAILTNPRYTGVAVWGRQRREEVLLDVEDVAAGHRTLMRWNNEESWVRSQGPAHEPLITPDLFERAQQRRMAGARAARRKPRRPNRPYVLRGLIHCGVCERRMMGSWNHDEAYYRCRYPSEYALTNAVEHPKTVYVRECDVLPHLNRWLAGVFHPKRLDETAELLSSAQAEPDQQEARVVAARRSIREAEVRLAHYREALDGGADAAIVAGWIQETAAEKAAAERVLQSVRPAPILSAEDIKAMLLELGNLVRVIEEADPARKAALYASLGLTLTYEPGARVVRAEADVGRCAQDRVGGGI
ncbi:MAG: recombinase family protein [Actinomycetota bacterium]